MMLTHILLAALLFWSSPQTGGETPAFQQDKPNIEFNFGFGAMVGTGAKKTFVAITRDTIVNTGDELKMVVELKSACFVYVIYQSSTGEVSMVFPWKIEQFASDYAQGKNYYIPKGRAWFKIDQNKGKETFHLMASVERLKELEEAVKRYHGAAATGKSTAAADVVKEIREARKRFKSYATRGERPVSIGGNVRGVEEVDKTKRPDVADVETEITAVNFFAKTFTLEHR